jgi:hypothetical protein
MATLTLNSPGVEIVETDQSLVTNLQAGTNVLVMGFAPQGPTYESINVTSISDFEQTFGTPTNAAERYFYHTCRQTMQSNGNNLLAIRLPYGTSTGDGVDAQFTALLYPVSAAAYGVGPLSSTLVPVSGQSAYANTSAYLIGQPKLINLTYDDYINWQAGAISWSSNTSNISGWTNSLVGSAADVGQAGIIVVNSIKTTLDDIYQGYYVGIADNSEFIDSNGNLSYNSIANAKVTLTNGGNWSVVNNSNLSFNLTGSNNSVSEDLESIPTNDFQQSDYNDNIILGLFKLQSSNFNDTPNILSKSLIESYTGSLNANKMISNPNGGSQITGFIGNKIDSSSVFMKMFVNPNLSKSGAWMNGNNYGGVVRVYQDANSGANNLFCMGKKVTTIGAQNNIVVGNIPGKVDVALRLVENKDEVPLDIVCEAGLGSLWVNSKNQTTPDSSIVFDESSDFSAQITLLKDQLTGYDSQTAQDYLSVFEMLQVFAEETRQDIMVLADPVRQIFVNGNNNKVMNSTKSNFSRDIYWALKNLYGAVNTSYAATYGNWVRLYDTASDNLVWIPMSGVVANIIGSTTTRLYPWTAPAGLNNGIINGITDIGVNPTQKQRDLLYRISVNPVCYFSANGYVVWGQKTLQKKPSAFDRINVRRLFLVLEKATYNLARYFVMEPNTNYTRTRLINTLDPIFKLAAQNEGIYSYLIKCDENNNTPDIIDNNELVCNIYIQPVRTAEFILINFIATRTGTNFSEVV